MLWENLTVIGSFLFGIVQFVFFCWLAMAILGFILGLMMDPYYGLPEDRHRKDLVAKRKQKENKR